MYGAAVETDVRLRKVVEREKFLLSVVMPRFRTLSDMRREWVKRTVDYSVLVPCAMVLVLHIGTAAACSLPGSALCAGGPDLEPDDEAVGWAKHAFAEYGPPMINALATLMLSFYANVCMGLYTEGYFSAKQLGESVLDVMTMVAGTIPPRMHEIRMEFWRCVNLYHLCTYVLADKQRSTYNLDNFLVPVASAFGEWDRKSKFGMLRLEELELLHDTEAQKMLTLARAADDAHAKNGGGDESFLESFKRRAQSASTNRIDKEQMALKRDKYHKKAKQAPTGAMDAMSERSEHSPAVLAPASAVEAKVPVGYEGHSKTLANSRGDVSSPAAVMHAALGVRLYMLVDLVLEEKMSRAAWPAWNAVCMKLRSNSERLKQRALFRLPRIYQASVRFLVASTILTDSYLLASHSARLLRNAHDSDEGWAEHTYFGAVVDLLLNLLLTWCLAVFLNAIGDMQTPFGGETLDMPGLSYVCGSAEVSLRMMVGVEQSRPDATSKSPANELFGLLNQPLDRQRLMRTIPAAEQTLAKREEEEEEEEEDGGDE